MTWSGLTHVLNTLNSIGLLAIVTSLIAWMGKRWSSRRMKVDNVTWSRPVPTTLPSGQAAYVPEVHLALFNGLTTDVGLHRIYLDLKRGTEVRHGLVTPITGELPETVKAQHSTDIRLDPEALHAMTAGLGSDSSGWSYRLRVHLGNGSTICTSWTVIPPARAASDPGGGVDSPY